MSFLFVFLTIGFFVFVVGCAAVLSQDREESHRTLTVSSAVPTIKYTLPQVPPQVPDPSVGPYRPLLDIVRDWNPDDVNPPANYREHLQYFDFGNPAEQAMALAYREAEVPFKLYNVSEFNEVSAKWTDEYLLKELSNTWSTHVEKSKNNHFMFWKGNQKSTKNWDPPTEIVTKDFNFQKFLKLAKAADLSEKNDSETEHYYFMANAAARDNGRGFISRDLKSFGSQKPNFFISRPELNKGIQCRFGMRGVIAESHYDSGRNFVAMLQGHKRYILSPPNTCKYLGIIADPKHPSYRHSVIDWSDITQAKQAGFDKVDAIETIMRQGEILYIPSYWFHYMESLTYSIQCNSRFGSPPNQVGLKDIKDCLKEGMGK